MRMDLVTLRLFVAVAEENSIASAAARENLVASAVSKRLAALEEDLGVILIKRHTKGVTLTPAGETLLQRARDILRSIETTANELSQYTSDGAVQVRLSANHSSIVQFLPDDLASFFKAHPRTRVDLVEKLSADVVRNVAEGSADVGIYCWPLLPKGLLYFPYREDELVVMVPPGHPLCDRESIDFIEAAPYQFIDYFPGASAAVVLPEFPNSSMSRLRIHVANFEASCRMVEAGIGISMLPYSTVLAREQERRLVCIKVRDAWAKRTLNICIREEMASRRSVMEFVDHLRGRAPRNMALTS